jgi:hypothetical protein
MNLPNISQNPKISVLLVDGSFRGHFALIDALKRQTFAAVDFEVLWIEYFAALKLELIEKLKGQSNFQAVTLKGQGVYHSSYCFNRGITQARGALLVILDADVLIEANFLESVWKEHQANDQLVMYVYRMDEPKRASGVCFDLDFLKKFCVLTNPENYGGCLTVRKNWLLSINGYEQHELLRGTAHANGRDLYTRFKNLGLPVKWHPELRLYHPWHPHPPGFKDGYLLQHVLIRHRAANLDVLPYKGIDPTLDREIPHSLQALLDAEKMKISQPHS